MKIYYATRNDARKAAKNKDQVKVVDCKSSPSNNGSRWAVAIGK